MIASEPNCHRRSFSHRGQMLNPNTAVRRYEVVLNGIGRRRPRRPRCETAIRPPVRGMSVAVAANAVVEA